MDDVWQEYQKRKEMSRTGDEAHSGREKRKATGIVKLRDALVLPEARSKPDPKSASLASLRINGACYTIFYHACKDRHKQQSMCSCSMSCLVCLLLEQRSVHCFLILIQ